MQRTIAGGLIAVTTALAASFAAAPAAAQDKTKCVVSKTDWSVCVEQSPKECWSVSTPRATRNTRDGQEVEVQRGDILLFVTFRPEREVQGEVSFTGGYPFAGGSTVTLEVGSDRFELFTEGEWAWPASDADDSAVVAALKRGADAKLTARSSRGTQTEDTFSLMGFTAAFDEAEGRCEG
jgi:hypothetical protein